MKFYVVVNFYLVSLNFIFQEDPCINERARVVNARICDITTKFHECFKGYWRGEWFESAGSRVFLRMS